MKANHKCIASATMSLVFLAFITIAAGFGNQAKLMPLLVGVPGFILSLVQLAKDLRQENSGVTESTLTKSEIRILIWLLGCLLAIVLFGFSWGASVMAGVYFHFILRERLVATLLSVSICYFVLEVILNRWLGAQLFEGLLFPSLQRLWA